MSKTRTSLCTYRLTFKSLRDLQAPAAPVRTTSVADPRTPGNQIRSNRHANNRTYGALLMSCMQIQMNPPQAHQSHSRQPSTAEPKAALASSGPQDPRSAAACQVLKTKFHGSQGLLRAQIRHSHGGRSFDRVTFLFVVSARRGSLSDVLEAKRD